MRRAPFGCTPALTAYGISHLFARPLLYSLARNMLGPEGCKAVAAVLDKTQITSLKCASHLAQRLDLCVVVTAAAALTARSAFNEARRQWQHHRPHAQRTATRHRVG